MPFRGFTVAAALGTPQQLLVADHGDVEVQIGTVQDGDSAGAFLGYDFEVGGPDIGTAGGLVCYDGRFRSEVSPGDEIWVQNVEYDRPTITLYVLVRSR